MSGPPPATAAVRTAVREALASAVLGADAVVVAAVSGGADSLALAAGLAFHRPGAGCLVVDHGLQPDSAQIACRAAEQCRDLGLTAEVLDGRGGPGPAAGHRALGPEGRAREVRYAVLSRAADRLGAQLVLLGHTRDDQAETVLLGLARGSGSRALAGMAARRDRWCRPLLALSRATTQAACREAGLVAWQDPHNRDPAYARARIRATVLPVLEAEVGPGVAAGLARTAMLLREDADALDALAQTALSACGGPTLQVADLAGLLPAVRSRVLKRWGEERAGRALALAHVAALRDLVERWHGQGAVALPGGTQVRRSGDRLCARGGRQSEDVVAPPG